VMDVIDLADPTPSLARQRASLLYLARRAT